MESAPTVLPTRSATVLSAALSIGAAAPPFAAAAHGSTSPPIWRVSAVRFPRMGFLWYVALCVRGTPA